MENVAKQTCLEKIGIEARTSSLMRNYWRRDEEYSKEIVDQEYDVQSEFVITSYQDRLDQEQMDRETADYYKEVNKLNKTSNRGRKSSPEYQEEKARKKAERKRKKEEKQKAKQDRKEPKETLDGGHESGTNSTVSDYDRLLNYDYLGVDWSKVDYFEQNGLI